MLVGLLALTTAAVFSGAAIYVLAVEHVAREALDDRAALTEWKPSYKRGAVMQASIALVGTALGALAWWRTGGLWFGIGAMLILLPGLDVAIRRRPMTACWPRRRTRQRPETRVLGGRFHASARP